MTHTLKRHHDGSPPADRFAAHLSVLLTAALTFSLFANPGWNLLWGMNAWGLLPTGWRLGLLAAGLAVIWGSRFVAGRFHGGSPAVHQVLVGAVAAGLVALWFLMPARTQLLGDSANILAGLEGEAPLTPRSPLYSLLLGWLGGSPGDASGPEVLRAVQGVSSACGLLFVLVVLVFLKRQASLTGPAPALFLGGYLGVFQGYVESYALFAVALSGYLLVLMEPPGRRRSAFLVLFQVLSIAAYVVGFLTVPVTLWALLGRGAGRRRRLLMAAGAAAAVFLGLAVLGPRLPASLGYLDPATIFEHLRDWVGLQSDRPWRRARFSLYAMQAVDALNGFLLSAAPVLLIMAALSASAPGRHLLKAAFRSPAGVTALLFLAARIFLISPLGPLLDWDLYSVLTIPLTFVVAGGVAAGGGQVRLGGAGPALAATAVILAAPVAVLLRSPELTVRRFETHLAGQPPPPAYVASHIEHRIGHQLAGEGRRIEAARAFERAFQLYPREEFARRAGVNWLMAGDQTKALAAFTLALGENPRDEKSLLQRSYLYLRRNRIPEAIRDLETVLEIDPANGHALLALGTACRRSGDAARSKLMLEMAVEALQRELRLKDNPRTRRELEDARRLLGEADPE